MAIATERCLLVQMEKGHMSKRYGVEAITVSAHASIGWRFLVWVAARVIWAYGKMGRGRYGSIRASQRRAMYTYNNATLSFKPPCHTHRPVHRDTPSSLQHWHSPAVLQTSKPLIGNDGMPMMKLPRIGEVQFLYSAPPCQDFSGLNRQKCQKPESFKKGQISSFLSMLDHYKPMYLFSKNVKTISLL